MSTLTTLQREIATLQRRVEPRREHGGRTIIYLPDNGRDGKRNRLAPSQTLQYGAVTIYGVEAR